MLSLSTTIPANWRSVRASKSEAKRKIDPKLLTDFGEQPHGYERMAAEREEFISGLYSFRAEKIGPVETAIVASVSLA